MQNILTRGEASARLRLVRYGLLVTVVVTFLVALLVPYAILSPSAPAFNELAEAARIDGVPVTIFTFLTEAIIATVIVAIVAVVIYVVYHYMLMKQLPMIGGDSEAAGAKA